MHPNPQPSRTSPPGPIWMTGATMGSRSRRAHTGGSLGQVMMPGRGNAGLWRLAGRQPVGCKVAGTAHDMLHWTGVAQSRFCGAGTLPLHPITPCHTPGGCPAAAAAAGAAAGGCEPRRGGGGGGRAPLLHLLLLRRGQRRSLLAGLHCLLCGRQGLARPGGGGGRAGCSGGGGRPCKRAGWQHRCSEAAELRAMAAPTFCWGRR